MLTATTAAMEARVLGTESTNDWDTCYSQFLKAPTRLHHGTNR